MVSIVAGILIMFVGLSPSDRSPRHSGREAPSGASAALQADRLDAGRPDFRFYFGMSYAHYPLTYHCVYIYMYMDTYMRVTVVLVLVLVVLGTCEPEVQ